MSKQGLLEKISEQQLDFLDAEINDPTKEKLDASRIAATLVITTLSLLVYFAMQFGIFFDYDLKVVVALLAGSFAILWLGFDLGIPGRANFSKVTASLVTASFLLVSVFPVVFIAILGGDLSLDLLGYEEDGEEITLTLRKNGIGSDSFDANLSIERQGSIIWSNSIPFKIDKSDGRGDYAIISVEVDDFYEGNAFTGNSQQPEIPYTLSIRVDDFNWERTLDSSFLTRNITGAGSYVSGVFSDDSNDCQDKGENCIVGVTLMGWVGLDSGSTIPTNLQFSSYTVNAVLMEEGDVAISYPAISVENTVASWASSDGRFGSGSATFGEINSEIRFEGSQIDPDSGGLSYIPFDHFEESAGDYGCYTFTVDVSPSGSEDVVSSTTYYEYSNSNSQDIWKQESSC
ncbi:MAG TPA: hypothetical protein EYQ11_00115 [Candidatus Poseidoniales archaeon]|jgi:hypothetical protein|nr:MAG: hypothetical protein CXT66_05660 [Euryarchaeota archaeon]HIG33275.1 hypothetical protein [Candidatus Poseidoniales archaeon]HIL67441.1 hypothetical protein [Candidatus Poseidoniales archaeon]